MPRSNMPWLAQFNANDRLQLLLLLRCVHDFPDHELNILKVNIITTDVFDLPLDVIRMHQDILC